MSFGKSMKLAAEGRCVYLDSCAVVKGFKIHKCGEKVVRADNNAVIFKHNGVYALFKFGGDVVSELAAAGEGIGRHCDISAEETCVGDD